MRLIDADNIDFNEVFVGASEFAQDTRNAAQMLIDAQPTAYDIDKVVEELESEKRYGSKYDSYYEENLYRGEMFENDVNNKTIDRAIEIVKQGGVYDYVCEWEYSGNVYISCNYKRFTDLHSFEYCPYCGKKIKVVE